MFNNQPFSGNSRVTIVADGLQFTNVMAADMGTYIVSFENQAGLSMYTFILTDSPDDFTPPPPPPRGIEFIEYPTDNITVVEGQGFDLNCKATWDGKRQDLTWIVYGSLVPTGFTFSESDSTIPYVWVDWKGRARLGTDYMSPLMVTGVTRDSEGAVVRCLIDFDKHYNQPEPWPTISVLWPVSLSTSTETREFSVGEAFIVNFTITDPGKPAGHNVSWTFNDRPFTGNNKVTILENGLQFVETQFEDQGTYVASFDNTAAVSTFTFSYGMVMSESAGVTVRATSTAVLLFLAALTAMIY